MSKRIDGWLDNPNELINIPILNYRLRVELKKRFIKFRDGDVRRQAAKLKKETKAAIEKYPEMKDRPNPYIKGGWLRNFIPDNLIPLETKEEEEKVISLMTQTDWVIKDNGFAKQYIDTLCWVLFGCSFDYWCNNSSDRKLIKSQTITQEKLVHPLMGLVYVRPIQPFEEMFNFIKEKKPGSLLYYGLHCNRMALHQANWVLQQVKKGTKFRFLIRHPDLSSLEGAAEYFERDYDEILNYFTQTFLFFSKTMKGIEEWAIDENISPEIYQNRFEVRLCNKMTYMRGFFLDLDNPNGVSVFYPVMNPLTKIEVETEDQYIASFFVGCNDPDGLVGHYVEAIEAEWNDSRITKRIDKVINSSEFKFEKLQGLSQENYDVMRQFYRKGSKEKT